VLVHRCCGLLTDVTQSLAGEPCAESTVRVPDARVPVARVPDARGLEEDAQVTESARIVAELVRCVTVEAEEGLRRRLVLLHIPVATRLALRYRGRGQALEDLVQTAHLGLVKAAAAFDPSRGNDFLAYAVPTINGEVKRHFRDLGWDIRPPRRVQELRAVVERASAELTQALGRPPRVSEIAAHLGLAEDLVVECVASVDVYNVHSLDASVGGNEDVSVADTIGGPDPALARVDDVLALRSVIGELAPRERRILALRYFSGWTQQQIAQEVGVSQMHVSRLIVKALHQLRDSLQVA
jgi:RNA polymerase sigma-B factor